MKTPNPNNQLCITCADSCMDQTYVHLERARANLHEAHSYVCAAINYTQNHDVETHSKYSKIRLDAADMIKQLEEDIKFIEKDMDEQELKELFKLV